jgi:tRNA nucleotidyltransferase (CCA-adding enzyme)
MDVERAAVLRVPMVESVDLAARLREIPGMDRLLPALEGLAPAFLVGGAVRDLLLGRRTVDLDVAIEGDARAVARELAVRLGGEAVEHERFGTATLRGGDLSLDLAATRRETYVEPGALPEVLPAGLAEDLGRRDFTINAMALDLNGPEPGRLEDPHGGRDDLDAGVIRVLHGESFIDDPTRLLRALRYEARFGFRMDEQAERLAREAASGPGFSTVSGARVRDELLDLLREDAATAALARMHELSLDRALHPSLEADAELVAGAQHECAQTGADRALAGLAALVSSAPDELGDWVEELHLGRQAADAVMRAAVKGRQLAATLRNELAPSAVHAVLSCEPPEALALALASGAPGAQVLRYLAELRGVRLEITGDDLIAAGIPESPRLGRALEETLRRKLDGEVSGRERELELALTLARGERP